MFRPRVKQDENRNGNKKNASINKRFAASINIGVINFAATRSFCSSRVSHPDWRPTQSDRPLDGRYDLGVAQERAAEHEAADYLEPPEPEPPPP
jgi:hypothetical protein